MQQCNSILQLFTTKASSKYYEACSTPTPPGITDVFESRGTEPNEEVFKAEGVHTRPDWIIDLVPPRDAPLEDCETDRLPQRPLPHSCSSRSVPPPAYTLNYLGLAGNWPM